MSLKDRDHLLLASACKLIANFAEIPWNHLAPLSSSRTRMPLTGAQNTTGDCNKADASGILRERNTHSPLAGCLQICRT